MGKKQAIRTLSSSLLIATSCSWTSPRHTIAPKQLEAHSHSVEAGRRSFLRTVCVSTLLVGPFSKRACAADSDDPFAQMDAIANSIQSSSSSYPNSISPLPTKHSTAQELTAPKPITSSPSEKSESSDIEKALKEAKSGRKVNPLTHG